MLSEQNITSVTILMIHFHSMQNAGDAAQLEAAILDLRKHFHEPRIIVAANHPEQVRLQNPNIEVIPSFASRIGVGSDHSALFKLLRFIGASLRLLFALFNRKRRTGFKISSKGWDRLLHAYNTADLIVSVPGNIFFTMGRFGLPFLSSALAILPTFIFRKPFYVLPQSIGPLKRYWERWVLRKLYQHANLIYLREPVSYRLAQHLKLPMKRVQLALDPTIEVKKPENVDIPRELLELGYTTGRISMGITVIPRMIKSLPQATLDRYYQTLAGSLSQVVSHLGMDLYFIPQVTGPASHEDDRKAFQEVISLLSCPMEQIKVLDQSLDYITVEKLYQRMDLFLASRLHSAIFAFRYAIPTLVIAYLSKSVGIMELLKLDEWLLDINQLEQHLLTVKLEALWQQRTHVSFLIRQNIADAIKRSPDPGFEIATDFYHGFG